MEEKLGGENEKTRELSRRKFCLLGAAAMTIGSTTTATSEALQLTNRQQSILSVGKSEVDMFELMMGVIPGDHHTFVSRVHDIQAKHGLSKDGVLGSKTLEKVYISEYAPYIQALPEMQKKRWEAYLEMQEYKNNPRIVNGEKLYVSQIPNVFDGNVYFGGGVSNDKNGVISKDTRDLFRPISNTMFASGVLEDGFDTSLRGTPNSIEIFKVGGRNALALYDDNGTVILATYTSPGEDSYGVSGSHVLETSGNFQMHHLSRDHGNAPMCYGINVQDRAFGIMVHGGVGKITGYDESKGCFRIGICYAKFIYDYITQNTDSYTININI